MGEWQRAEDQLALIEELDSGKNFLFTQAYHRALVCEAERRQVHVGEADPVVFGQPSDWIGLLIQAFRMAQKHDWADAAKAQAAAFERAPETPGQIDGEETEWIADGDSRFGPVLEAFIEGHYRWVPFSQVRRLEVQAPTHVIDVVWLQARFTWTNEGQVDGLIPTRYFGTESNSDDEIRSARGLVWSEPAEGYFIGQGVRQLIASNTEKAIMQIRQIELR